MFISQSKPIDMHTINSTTISSYSDNQTITALFCNTFTGIAEGTKGWNTELKPGVHLCPRKGYIEKGLAMQLKEPKLSGSSWIERSANI
jgi:hypothetical protein